MADRPMACTSTSTVELARTRIVGIQGGTWEPWDFIAEAR